MSDLNSRELRKLERLLCMGDGYVLNFSNRTFSDFFVEFVGKDIDDDRYHMRGSSKANRMRAFWDLEPNHIVAKALTELIAHGLDAEIEFNTQLLEDCRAIVSRLASGQAVADIEAIAAAPDNRDFELVARAARESIDANEPAMGLDRLHTFVVKFMRHVCSEHGLPHDRNIPLNGLFGSYVKQMAKEGKFASEMTERILKSSIANLEAFNHVRNNHTLAHDNDVLGYDEALLIFNHVASAVRFVKSLEQDREAPAARPEPTWDEDIPF